MMVVPVLMTNCHVSLKSNIGPVTIHTRIKPAAIQKLPGFPAAAEVAFANRLKIPCERDKFFCFPFNRAMFFILRSLRRNSPLLRLQHKNQKVISSHFQNEQAYKDLPRPTLSPALSWRLQMA